MRPDIIIKLIGLKRLLQPKTLKISKSELYSAMELDKELEQLSKKLIAQEPISVKHLSLSDIKECIENLKDFNPDVSSPLLIEEFDRVGIAPEMTIALMELIAELQRVLPTNEAFSDLVRFGWKLRLIDSPLYVYELMSKSELSGSDVSGLTIIYPELHQEIVNYTIAEVVDKFKPTDPLPRKLKLMLSTLTQSPMLDVKTVQVYKKPPENAKVDIQLGAAQA